MNKKIKRIIAIMLTISAFAVFEPAKYNELMLTKVYAADGIAGISGLMVGESSGSSTIKMYKNADYSTPIRFDGNTSKYYIKLRRYVNEFNVRATVDSGYTVKVIDKSDDNKEYDLEEGIPIKKLEDKTIRVEITNNVDSTTQSINLRVYREGEDGSTDEESTNSSIYLKDVTLSHSGYGIALNFKPETDTYNINVDESVNNIKVEVNPDDKDDKVRINDSSVEEGDGYKKVITINEGKNQIIIIVKNTDDERIYTINVTRGSNPKNSNENTGAKLNQWVKINGLWQYNDAAGNPVKSTWVQNYYLKADGNMATEWLNINGSWYYFGEDGAKKKGWQKINGTWYFLDTAEGKMKTGWYKDSDGKWYYLNSDGSMAYNTTISGYRFGSSGAWI